MKESDYIQATNLARLRIARSVIGEVIPFRNQRYGDERDLPSTYGLEETEKIRIYDILDQAIVRIERTQ